MAAEGWVENAPGSPRLGVRALWGARELVGFLAWRDLAVRYKQTALGVAWAVLQPVAAAALFTLVFRRLAGVPSDGLPYPVFALAGYLLWTYTSAAANASRQSLLGNAPLITRVYFPRLVLPLAALLPPAVDLLVGLVVLAVAVLLYGAAPGAAVLLAPVFLLAAAVVAAGVGTLAGSLSVRYRDVQQIFAFGMQLWLFASPVVYPSSLVAGPWRWLYWLNPMAGILDGWRWAVVGGPAPGPQVAVSLAAAAAVLALGLVTFARLERTFADVI